MTLFCIELYKITVFVGNKNTVKLSRSSMKTPNNIYTHVNIPSVPFLLVHEQKAVQSVRFVLFQCKHTVDIFFCLHIDLNKTKRTV